MHELTDLLRAQAKDLGFDLFGVAPAGAVDERGALARWVERGQHAGLRWMEERQAERHDPRVRVAGAKSVVALGMNYHHPRPPAAVATGEVSRYAWARDYHNLAGKRVRELAARFRRLDPRAVVSAAVDTAPVMEKHWAQQAGLGWIGKHGNLITEAFGSWVFLACLITDRELAYDEPARDQCGDCSLCRPACPTGAIVEPYIVDARRCIAFHTIENRGAIPRELRAAHGSHVFGCDDCQLACPWDRRARASAERDFAPRHPDPDLAELLALDEADFRARFAGSPLTRARRSGLVRNACVAAGNSGRRELVPALARCLRDEDPLVRAHAAWALGRLGARDELRRRRPHEPAPEVRAEIDAALV